MVSREAIESVAGAEEEVRIRKAAALKKAAEDIAAAENDAAAAIAAGIERAEEEIEHMKNAGISKAEENAVALAEKTSSEQRRIKSTAAKKLDAAAALIIERIVNG